VGVRIRRAGERVSEKTCALCGTPRLERKVLRHWRVVSAGKVYLRTSERTHLHDAERLAQYWADMVRRGGHDVRVEVWDEVWWTTESEWHRVDDDS
jgi:ribosomal protein L37E